MACPLNSRNRSSRKKHVENKFDNLQSLALSDVQCTACMGIFIEPVTLPCNHAMCKECFQKTIDNNPLSCPLCRKYIGGWIRKVQKTGKLVNDRLWLHVQTTFSTHVQRKLAGEEDEEMEELARQFLPGPHLCEPGEIRQEYEAEQERNREEARKRDQAEAEASRKLIQQLQEVEEAKREMERRELHKREEEDARMAQQLAQEELELQEKESENVRSAFVSLPKKSTSSSGHPVVRGPMDAFVSQSAGLSRTDSACSNDSLHSELQHFKPLVAAPCTPPKALPNGKSERKLPIWVPVMRDLEAASGSSRLSIGTLSSPLRPWELSEKKEDPARCGRSTTDSSSSSSVAVSKRPSVCPSANSPNAKRACTEWSQTEYDDDDDEGYAGSDRSKEQEPAEVDAGGLPLSAAELRLQLAAAERLRQEILDRDLAMRLQAELNAESAPAYQLRSGDSKATPPRKIPPRKKPASASKDNRRQRTLEETMAVSRHSLRTTLK